jgi:TPR repeat protein
MRWVARISKPRIGKLPFLETTGALSLSFSKGCEEGDPGGCLGSGFMYENGQGVEQDSERAAEFFSKGCKGGNESYHKLANLSPAGMHVDSV